jgi:hypothetical protein
MGVRGTNYEQFSRKGALLLCRAVSFGSGEMVEQVAGPDLEGPRDVYEVFEGQIFLPALHKSYEIPVDIRHLGELFLRELAHVPQLPQPATEKDIGVLCHFK